MKKRTGIHNLIEKARKQAHGDALGVMSDWRLQAAAVDASWKRYEEHATDKTREVYLAALKAMLPIIGVKGAATFRARHRAIVSRLAPGSEMVLALSEPPPLKADPAVLEDLAKSHQLIKRPVVVAEEAASWKEPDIPALLGSQMRVETRIRVGGRS